MGREEGDPTGGRGEGNPPGGEGGAFHFLVPPRRPLPSQMPPWLGLCLSAGTFRRTWVQDGGSEACVCPQVWAGCMVVTGAGLWLEAPGEACQASCPPRPPMGPRICAQLSPGCRGQLCRVNRGLCSWSLWSRVGGSHGTPEGRLRGLWELAGEQRPARPGVPSDFGPWRLAWPQTREPGGDRMADGAGRFCDGSVGRAQVL